MKNNTKKFWIFPVWWTAQIQLSRLKISYGRGDYESVDGKSLS